MMTTRKPRRQGQQMGLLQATLITGSLAATALGTGLLANANAEPTAAIIPESTPLVIKVPLPQLIQSPGDVGPPSDLANSVEVKATAVTPHKGITVQLQPVTKALVPQLNPPPQVQEQPAATSAQQQPAAPVAKSKSSG